MPAISSIAFTATTVTLGTRRGVRTFDVTSIPPNQRQTPAELEDRVNTWLIANIPDAQVRVHVFQVTPTIQFTVGTFNLDLAIPDNWWEG